MSPEVQIALIVAVPPTIASVGALIVSVMQARRADGKLDQIHTLTNSTLTAANKRIELLENSIRGLLPEQEGIKAIEETKPNGAEARMKP